VIAIQEASVNKKSGQLAKNKLKSPINGHTVPYPLPCETTHTHTHLEAVLLRVVLSSFVGLSAKSAKVKFRPVRRKFEIKRATHLFMYMLCGQWETEEGGQWTGTGEESG